MPTAKKLPSGSWRVLVYSHKENGKRKFESFTAPTKKEAELMAAEWKNGKRHHDRTELTVKDAIQGYINAKEGVLSPSTVRGYLKMLHNNYDSIQSVRIDKLTSETIQTFVSSLAIAGKSPKTVRNIYGLLISSVSLYLPDTTFRVTLPQKHIRNDISPSNEDVCALYKHASPELKKCIALAAFGSLRRGEICALTYTDLHGDVISVSRDMVQNKDNKWVIKDIPKTEASVRTVKLPEKVVELLGSGAPGERIINYQNPGSITQCFTKLRNRLGLNIHFHQLRHFYASIGAVLGIPDTYLSDFGGWSRGSNVMKEIYQNKIVSMSNYYSDKMTKHFDGII